MLEFAASQDQRFFDVLGMAGVAVYLGSYAALQTGLLKGQTYTYAALNILAASLVLVSLSRDFNLAAAAIQVSWIAISAAGIARLIFIHCRTTFTDEEAHVVQALVPDLPRHRARRLISLGRWCRAQPRDVLLRQGAPVECLDFLIEGRCEVERDGALIARIGPDCLVGEMGYLSGEPASATVRAIEPVRYVSFDADRLRAEMLRNPDLASALERSVARVLRARLSAATDDICLLRQAAATRRTPRDGVWERVDKVSGAGAIPPSRRPLADVPGQD